MNSVLENRFYHYAKGYLKEEFASETALLDEEQLKQKIDKGLRAAHASHFSTEAEAMAFIDIDWRLGGVLSAAELPAWAEEIIRNTQMTPEQKLYRLRDACCTMEWLGHGQ